MALKISLKYKQMFRKYPKLYSKLFSDVFDYKIKLLRFISNKPKYVADMDSEVSDQFDNGLKHRQHVGRRRLPTVSLPTRLESAAILLINKYNCHQFREDVNEMNKSVVSLQLPAEPQEIKIKSQEIRERIASKDGFDLKSLTEEERIDVLDKRKRKLERSLKDSLINHQPIEYNDYSSMAYMTARLPANYASLFAVFNGIKKDIPDFKPKTLFDFGSGVGSTIWAANEVWPKSFDEYFCVDMCQEMNEISRLLLQCGKENKKMIYDPVFYRQYLPVSHTIKYDLVVSAFSLLDITDARNRVHVIENLWHKTQDLLVIVENGSRAGFAAVLEARNLVLQLAGHKITADIKLNPNDTQLSTVRTTTDATLVSPCPHDMTCPRQSSKGPVLCNFEISYNPLNFGQKKAVIGKQRYSYVVIHKGSEQTELKSWPRIVQPVLTGHHRAICRMCCSDGTLKEVVITKSNHDKNTYRCAKVSRWGDKLPVVIRDKLENHIKSE